MHDEFLDVLVVHRESRTAVLLPASLCVLGAKRFFLAIADYTDAAGCHSRLDQ
jgi:hypothetical protein